MDEIQYSPVFDMCKPLLRLNSFQAYFTAIQVYFLIQYYYRVVLNDKSDKCYIQ